jgi:hypothetical protein
VRWHGGVEGRATQNTLPPYFAITYIIQATQDTIIVPAVFYWGRALIVLLVVGTASMVLMRGVGARFANPKSVSGP